MSIYIGDKEIKNLYVGESTSVSDMQGPCPDGFHVPLSSEWSALGLVLFTALGLPKNPTAMKTYLKMAMAGRRRRDSSDVQSQGEYGYYFSSSSYSDNSSDVYGVSFYGSKSVSFDAYLSYTHGCPVRGFKDSPVIPDSSWTTLYDGSSVASGAGVFRNSSLGLISVSGDGQTWYTIMDKNLGATTVYNDGDTLSEANCGGYFQRGNNYMFPFTGSVTTSSTKVDANGYGPGNYYSSNIFITASASPYNWASVKNANLWGGVTQGTTETGAAKAVYLGENKVRPSADTRTFTISRTEKSNMSSGWTYSDDAAGLTAGSTAFDEFFGYYGCRLNTSGVETAKITQEESGGAGKLDITQLGTLTSGDNVMIAFPVMGIKMSKSGSTVTLSITKELNKSGYQYYAHSTGTLSNPGTPKDVFYLGAYKAYNNSSVLKSRSGKTPTGSLKQSASCTYAQANGTGYNIIGFYQRMYVNALYMMKYGNPNSKSTVGIGYADGYSAPTTGGTNSQTNATYGTTSATGRVKLFGLEDWWGGINEYVGGAYTDSNKQLYTMLSNRNGELSGGEWTGTTISQTGSYTDLSSIAGDNKAMFAPIGTANSSSWSTYYSVYTVVQASRLAMAGGYYQNSNMSGAFNLQFVVSTSNTYSTNGNRLMYLNGLT